jgi:predicted enzyme related to lactoylglutathione lyase
MKTMILAAVLTLGTSFNACTSQNNSASQTQKADTTELKATKNMKNLVSIVEIPVSDFSRAVAFYKAVLDVSIEEVEMGEFQMGLLPGNEESVNVVLVKGSGYKPSADGLVVYLNAGEDLQTILDKIESNGGKTVTPKTQISPEMGYFAVFTDIEGNRLALHSLH